MMWSSIENLKQNLNKIALDVHDDDEELEMHASSNGYDSSVCNRRNSHRFAHSKSVIRCLVANGNGSPYNFEIEQYKAQIKRLQESEVEIKALSINYAAVLKEKEDQISRLNQENGSLKQKLDATKEALNVSRTVHLRISTSGFTAIKSFAGMWVDFLLKETEEREKRGSGQEDTGKSHESLQGRSPNAAGVGSPVPYHGTSISGIAGPNFVQSDSEFSTVPLTPFDNSSRISRLPTKH